MHLKSSYRNRILISSIIFLSVILLALTPFTPHEGMFPLSEIHKLDLKKAGLKINVDEVYNPNGVSLIDALVKVGGCTGSFVSENGLIITNHHCAFGAVQRASTTENNYLKNGFLAKDYEEEIPAKGIICRITESYQDVSDIILKAANEVDDVSKREDAIKNKMDELVKAEEEKDSTIKAVISEMFEGQSYVLFRYKIINDVRLVYVPPRAIGEFGGESDNWVWPRHTGDFSFMRAYISPDGKAANYSKNNVPYHPQKFLKVNPQGVNEGDFIFILGYPGRTYKNQPSQFLIYQQEYQLPYIQQLYSWLINLYEKRGKNDPDFALKISTRIKGLANVEKNYRGKLQGLNRLKLIEKRQKQESDLGNFINGNTDLKNKYGDLLTKINSVYNKKFESGRIPLFNIMLNRNVSMMRLASLFIEYRDELQKPENERKSIYKESNKKKLFINIDDIYKNYYPDLEPDILKKMLNDVSKFPEFKTLTFFEKLDQQSGPINPYNKLVDEIYKNSLLVNKEKFESLFRISTEEIEKLKDPMINFYMEMNKIKENQKIINDITQGELNILIAKYLEIKKLWLNKSFIPDANGTLRLTYGYIKGYSPADAVYYKPITTLSGVIEKGKDFGDYKLPEKIKELYEKKDYGQFKSDKLNDIPVAILYNTDTSGGNSGSPIMDAYGRLVGVNFDRPFEATVNDYAWSKDYSRSIGVDIRYVLWITQKIGGAEFLLKEMGVNI